MAESTDGDKRPLAGLIRENLAEGVMTAGFFLFSATFLILAVQFFYYLKDGVWPKWVLLFLIRSILPAPFIDWLAYPQDWHGLHKIVASMLLESPISVDTLLLSFILLWGATKIGDG